MKVSKKQIAKWQDQERKRSEGRVANNLELEAATQKIRNNPELLRVIKRMKDR